MKKFLLPVIAFGVMTMSACDDDHDHDHGDVTISFLHPVDDEEVSMAHASDLEIHVKFEWDGDEGEAVEVKVYPENDPSDLIINFTRHQHDKVFEFEEDVNLSSYPVGTEFHVWAKGCEDHDCDKFEEASIHFKLVE